MRRKVVVTSATAVAALVLAAIVFYLIVARRPQCLALSDQDLIDRAAQYEITGKKRHIDLVHTPDLIQYRSPSELLQKNPKCCSIDRANHELTTAVDRVLGATEVWVTLWYRAAGLGEEPFYQAQVALDSCGRIIASRGMSISVGPMEEGNKK